MPCICEIKVDRNEINKLLCKNCKQYSHAKCYNINVAEFAFVKHNFKCKKCARRSSVSAGNFSSVADKSDSIVVIDDSASSGRQCTNKCVEAENKVSDLTDNISSVVAADKSDSIVVMADTGCSVVAVKPDSIDVVAADDVFSKSDVIPVSSPVPNSNISLIDIYNELILLKKNNVCLNNFVLSLRDDNTSLKTNIEQLNKQLMALTNENSILSSKVDKLLSIIRKPQCTLTSNAVSSGTIITKSKPSEVKNSQIEVIENKPVAITKNKYININAKKSFADIVSEAPVDSVPKLIKTNLNAHTDVVVEDNVLSNSAEAAVVVTEIGLPNKNINTDVVFDDNVLSKSAEAAVVVAEIDLPNKNINTDLPCSADNNEKWEAIKNNKSNKNNHRRLIGARVSNELKLADKMKWLHISSFANTVEPEDIINYLSKHTNINVNQFACYKLIKKNRDLSQLKFVNFKLGVSSTFYETIFNADIWPANTSVKSFNFLGKNLKPMS